MDPDDLPEDLDDRVALLLVACDEALPTGAQLVLALRVVCGLSVREIATHLGIEESAAAARLTRAKKSLSRSRDGFAVPGGAERATRLPVVLACVAGMFTVAHRDGFEPVDPLHDLGGQALSIADALVRLWPEDTEVRGLRALVLLGLARRPGRVDADGVALTLDEVDRSRWDARLVRAGLRDATLAATEGTGRFALEAAISGLHTTATGVATTDWVRIVALYDALARIWPSPAVEVAHLVARTYADPATVAEVEAALGHLAEHGPAYARRDAGFALADLLWRTGRRPEAAAHYETLAELALTGSVRRFCLRRRPERFHGSERTGPTRSEIRTMTSPGHGRPTNEVRPVWRAECNLIAAPGASSLMSRQRSGAGRGPPGRRGLVERTRPMNSLALPPVACSPAPAVVATSLAAAATATLTVHAPSAGSAVDAGLSGDLPPQAGDPRPGGHRPHRGHRHDPGGASAAPCSACSRTASLPGVDMIMMRLTSAEIDRVGGIWAGMSGSPVYAADGRLHRCRGLRPRRHHPGRGDHARPVRCAGSSTPLPVARDVAVPQRMAARLVDGGAVTAREAEGGLSPPADPGGGVRAERAPDGSEKAQERLGMEDARFFRAGAAKAAPDGHHPRGGRHRAGRVAGQLAVLRRLLGRGHRHGHPGVRRGRRRLRPPDAVDRPLDDDHARRRHRLHPGGPGRGCPSRSPTRLLRSAPSTTTGSSASPGFIGTAPDTTAIMSKRPQQRHRLRPHRHDVRQHAGASCPTWLPSASSPTTRGSMDKAGPGGSLQEFTVSGTADGVTLHHDAGQPGLLALGHRLRVPVRAATPRSRLLQRNGFSRRRHRLGSRWTPSSTRTSRSTGSATSSVRNAAGAVAPDRPGRRSSSARRGGSGPPARDPESRAPAPPRGCHRVTTSSVTVPGADAPCVAGSEVEISPSAAGDELGSAAVSLAADRASRSCSPSSRSVRAPTRSTAQLYSGRRLGRWPRPPATGPGPW